MSGFSTPTSHLMPKEGNVLDGYDRLDTDAVNIRDSYPYLDMIRTDQDVNAAIVRAHMATNSGLGALRFAVRKPNDKAYTDPGFQMLIGANGFLGYHFYVEGVLPFSITSGGIYLHGQNIDERYLRKAFESPLLPLTGGAISVAHGLGVKPTMVHAVFRCVTAAGGYSVGEEIHAADFEKSYTNTMGASTWANISEVGFSWRNKPFLTAVKAGGSPYDPDPAHWNLKLRAFV